MSVNQGGTWNMAQLPPVGHEQFYSILGANEDMVFMHVDEPGGWSIEQVTLGLIMFGCNCNSLVITVYTLYSSEM